MKVIKPNSGDWFFEWDCAICMDSGIYKGLLGLDQCAECQAYLGAASYRLFGAISLRLGKGLPIDDQLLNMGRALVSACAAEPLQGEALAHLLKISGREVKEIAKRLRDEWHLPVIGSRTKPRGYFLATNADEFLEWGRVTRSQAVSELATYYNLFKANFPALAGQQSLDFITTVSTELQEAIR